MSDRCSRCNRKLKDEQSLQRGYGPVCWVKEVGKREKRKGQGKLFKDADLPFSGDIVLKRTPGGEALTNVPQVFIEHSPSGFEWGYGGSGPADLALNILALFADENTAKALHQVFKWDFIAPLPFEGGSIKGREIKKWLRKHQTEAS